MKETLSDKCSTILSEAVQSLMETGRIQQAIFFGKGNDLHHINLPDPDSPCDKKVLTSKLVNYAEEIGAEYVITLSDCLTNKLYESHPSLDLKRIEAIVMTCIVGADSFVTMQEYIRTEDNQILLGDRFTDDADADIFASITPKNCLSCRSKCSES